MSALRERAIKNTPRCLSQVNAQLEESDFDQDVVQYSLSLSETNCIAWVFGYSLRNYNQEFKGELFFISPIILEWKESGDRTLIFDSDVHGYHGEMGASAKLRGSGEAAIFKCPECENEFFKLHARFEYCEAIYDLWEDEPEIDIENYFSLFSLKGVCTNCNHETLITEMDL